MENHRDNAAATGNFVLETLDTPQSERARSSFLIDLRKSPRVETRLPGSLVSGRGVATGLVTNLSRGGLRFEGGQGLADLISADAATASESDPLIVEVSFELPHAGMASATVIVAARIAYITQDGPHDCQCGLEFRSFADGAEALREYLTERGAY